MVVGLPKSGIIPGIMIASFKNKRFLDIDSFQFALSSGSGVRKYSHSEVTKSRVLVVDDSVNTGAEFKKTRDGLKHMSGEFDFVFLAVYGVTPEAKAPEADIVLSHVCHPRIFQWNAENRRLKDRLHSDKDSEKLREKLDWNRKRVQELEAKLASSGRLSLGGLSRHARDIVTKLVNRQRPQAS